LNNARRRSPCRKNASISHPLDGFLESAGDLDLHRPQHRTGIDQILQHLELQRRAARQVAAIGEDLNRQLALECFERLRQARLGAAENGHTGNQALERPQPPGAGDLPRCRPREMAELGDEAR
jgi:hypothetical protein